jgi:hypothetical protein
MGVSFLHGHDIRARINFHVDRLTASNTDSVCAVILLRDGIEARRARPREYGSLDRSGSVSGTINIFHHSSGSPHSPDD